MPTATLGKCPDAVYVSRLDQFVWYLPGDSAIPLLGKVVNIETLGEVVVDVSGRTHRWETYRCYATREDAARAGIFRLNKEIERLEKKREEIAKYA